MITDSNHIGIINPFRYRSYYYDEETHLYYLNSRYYNPQWGRFVNVDGIIAANNDILSHNMYLYCSNEPICQADDLGNRTNGVGGTYLRKAIGIANQVVQETLNRKQQVPSSDKIVRQNEIKVESSSVEVQKGRYGDGDLPFLGPPNGHDFSPNGLKERWWKEDGLPRKDRHYTDHGNSKEHPVVPHDHDWGYKDNGHWEPGPWRVPTDDIATGFLTGVLLYGGYQVIKWAVAFYTAPLTGGVSLGIAGATP